MNLAIVLPLGQPVFADTVTGDTETESPEDSSKYVTPIIPKPDNIPGPEESAQGEQEKIFGNKILPRIAVIAIGLVGGLSLLFLVIAGVRFATAFGNEEAVGNAKKQAIFAVVGLVLAMLSYAIVSILTNIRFVGDTSPDTVPTTEEPAET